MEEKRKIKQEGVRVLNGVIVELYSVFSTNLKLVTL